MRQRKLDFTDKTIWTSVGSLAFRLLPGGFKEGQSYTPRLQGFICLRKWEGKALGTSLKTTVLYTARRSGPTALRKEL